MLFHLLGKCIPRILADPIFQKLRQVNIEDIFGIYLTCYILVVIWLIPIPCYKARLMGYDVVAYFDKSQSVYLQTVPALGAEQIYYIRCVACPSATIPVMIATFIYRQYPFF